MGMKDKIQEKIMSKVMDKDGQKAIMSIVNQFYKILDSMHVHIEEQNEMLEQMKNELQEINQKTPKIIKPTDSDK